MAEMFRFALGFALGVCVGWMWEMDATGTVSNDEVDVSWMDYTRMDNQAEAFYIDSRKADGRKREERLGERMEEGK